MMTFSYLKSFLAGMCLLLQTRSLRITLERSRTTPWREAIRVYGSEDKPRCDIYTGDPNAPTFMLIKNGSGSWKLGGHCHNQLRQMIKDHYTSVSSHPNATCREVIERFPLPSSANAEQAIRMVCDYSLATMPNEKVEYLSSQPDTPRESEVVPEQRTYDWTKFMVSLTPELCGLQLGTPPQLATAMYRPPSGNWIAALRCENAANDKPDIVYITTLLRNNTRCIDMLKAGMTKQPAPFPEAWANECSMRDQIPEDILVPVPPEPLREAMSRGISSGRPTSPTTAADRNSPGETFPPSEMGNPQPETRTASQAEGTYLSSTSTTTERPTTPILTTSTTQSKPTPTSVVEVTVKPHNAAEANAEEVEMMEEDDIIKTDPSVVAGHIVEQTPLSNSTLPGSKSSARASSMVTNGVLMIAMIAVFYVL